MFIFLLHAEVMFRFFSEKNTFDIIPQNALGIIYEFQSGGLAMSTKCYILSEFYIRKILFFVSQYCIMKKSKQKITTKRNKMLNKNDSQTRSLSQKQHRSKKALFFQLKMQGYFYRQFSAITLLKCQKKK